jgi:hypothetical protein
VVGDDEAEHGVAEELEPLVGRRPRRLCAPGAVGEGAGEQVVVVEAAVQARGERLEGGGEDQGCAQESRAQT